MYDPKKTVEIKTLKVKDIIIELSKLNPEAELLICGDDYGYIHVEEDGLTVNFDVVCAEELNGIDGYFAAEDNDAEHKAYEKDIVDVANTVNPTMHDFAICSDDNIANEVAIELAHLMNTMEHGDYGLVYINYSYDCKIARISCENNEAILFALNTVVPELKKKFRIRTMPYIAGEN